MYWLKLKQWFFEYDIIFFMGFVFLGWIISWLLVVLFIVLFV